MFPLQTLRNCAHKAVSIELLNGEVVKGVLAKSDNTMNVVLRTNVVRTAADGAHFWSAREVLIRGSSISTVRMDPAALAPPKKKSVVAASAQQAKGRGRGGGRGAGRGRGEGQGGRGRGEGGRGESGRGRGGRGRGRGGDAGRKRPREE